jgi:hypothetical protein
MSPVEFAARALGSMLHVAATDPNHRLLVDYADLPAAVWQRIAPHFGLEVDAETTERMIELSRFYSKDSESRVFTGDAPEHRPINDGMRDAVQRFAEPAYRALAADS